MQRRVEFLIENKQFEFFDSIIISLLYHHQTNFCYKLFSNTDYGQELIEKFQPLYYATSILVGKDQNILLKIPPEIQQTVDAILVDIKERQEFYYGKKMG